MPFELPVNIQPGLHSQTIAVAVGYGRRAVGKVGDGVGVDVFPATKVNGELLAFSGQTLRVRPTGRYYKLAQTQWHNQTENRPIINDISLAEYKKDASAANHTDPHLRLKEVPSIWPMHDYSKGYQWGMTIDLNACTGCGACTIACQAENNVPVVGRENVRISREMHWIRIDRYYSGTPDQPSVVFQPMLCQHCENAPCETVCPVLATVHSDDGLNQQIYNRCVGTRYCSNNCPYKVRRFNFFDHWKAYEGTLNMVWNPEVTVRSRGIMEKCTFCVQRIRDSRDKSVLEGRHIRDGELKTACQQTCPTEAIAFGNINDKYSQVSKLRDHPRAFRVLEVLNTKPRISYMSKVRNVEAPSSHGHEKGHAGGHES
ncbi:4Fe-4S dicluster domain-containing protein [bacterium]|nr:4Fe-4S dicluster domain-containing protein [bacterium]